VADPLSLLIKDAFYKGFTIEYQQVFHLLSYSNEFDRNAEFTGDGEYYATLSRSVELGDGQCGYVCGREEMAGLFDGILSGGPVKDQEDLVGRFRYDLLDHTLDLGEFLHQMRFVM
jgi:hypothetical protein